MQLSCSTSQRRDANVRFGLGIGFLAVSFGILLPMISRRPTELEWDRFLDRVGVDPSAMYYSDLDRMAQMRAATESARQHDPAAFWIPTALR